MIIQQYTYILFPTSDNHPFIVFISIEWVNYLHFFGIKYNCVCFQHKIGKPRGLRTARKLKDHRREQRWHDKDYKKSHLGSRWKSNPFAGASHAKGIVLEKVYVYLCSFSLLE
jgi:hypothetical protein